MSQKFNGTFSALYDAVNSTGIPGRWISNKSIMHTFHSVRGGVINWWHTTKTIQFQGKIDAKDHLAKSLRRWLS